MDDCVLHQALHGYAGGHRLLASSLDLSVQAKETIAALSDLSGTRPQEGFETYLTGYPLPGTSLFVFARTWMAVEMPRPGCVWTHSILIPQAELDRGVDLMALTRVHARPVGANGFTAYESPLAWPRRAVTPDPQDPRGSALLSRLLPALYSSGSPPVVVATTEPMVFEQAIVGLWDQQWPLLRRTFLFCTGSLAPRTIHGRYFDLQLMPRSAARAASHDSTRGVVIVEEGADSTLQHPGPLHHWVNATVTDITRTAKSRPFREWLHLAAECSTTESRDGGVLLFTLADALSAAPPKLDIAISSIAHAFEAPPSCLSLKRAVLGSQTRLPETAVLAYVATAELPPAFGKVDLQVGQRARLLWESDPLAAQALIERILDNPTQLGERMLQGMAEAMPVDALINIGVRCQGLLYSAAVKNPALLLDRRVWSLPGSASEAAAALAAIPDEVRPRPVELLTASRAAPPKILEQVLQTDGANFLRAFLESDEGRGDGVLRALSKGPWKRLAREQHAVMRVWLANHPPSLPLARALAAAASTLDLTAVPIEHWFDILPVRLSASDLPLAAALFGVALADDSRQAGALAGRTFGIVHQGARDSSLSEEQWNGLGARLPRVPNRMEWDRCERIRRGFVDAFISRKAWQFVDFVVPFESDSSILEAVFAYARNEERGRKFLKRLAEAIDNGRVKVGPTQRRIIEEHARKRLSDYLSF